MRHYSLDTERAYMSWFKKFVQTTEIYAHVVKVPQGEGNGEWETGSAELGARNSERGVGNWERGARNADV